MIKRIALALTASAVLVAAPAAASAASLPQLLSWALNIAFPAHKPKPKFCKWEQVGEWQRVKQGRNYVWKWVWIWHEICDGGQVSP